MKLASIRAFWASVLVTQVLNILHLLNHPKVTLIVSCFHMGICIFAIWPLLFLIFQQIFKAIEERLE